MIRTIAVAGQSSTKITGSKGSDLIGHTQFDRCVVKRGQRVIELNHALTSFYNATVELGVSDKVTTFTASDFGRTLTSNGDGTDHGWGSHQMVMGDGVDGGKILATFQSSLSGVTMTLVKAESSRQPRSINMRLRLRVGTD